jgi:deoxycytidylate deaminase
MRLGISSLDPAGTRAALRELSGDGSDEARVTVAAVGRGEASAQVVLYSDARDSPASVARVPSAPGGARDVLDRLVDGLSSKPGVTPNASEYWMSIAWASSFRTSSTQLAVGATLVRDDTILGIGTNEVPLSGGKFNWSGDANDIRDYLTLRAATRTRRQQVVDQLIAENGWSEPQDGAALSQLNSVIDVERAVHAEVAAVLAAARIGAGSVGATMYVTHRPCYRCERFLTAAGVARVVFDSDSNSNLSEPLATELRADLDVTRFIGIRWQVLRHAIVTLLSSGSGPAQ